MKAQNEELQSQVRDLQAQNEELHSQVRDLQGLNEQLLLQARYLQGQNQQLHFDARILQRSLENETDELRRERNASEVLAETRRESLEVGSSRGASSGPKSGLGHLCRNWRSRRIVCGGSSSRTQTHSPAGGGGSNI